MDTLGAETKEFTAGSAFRIYGIGLDIDGITRELGVRPDHQHKKGETDVARRPYTHDMWLLSSPLGNSQELELHLIWLAERLLRHQRFILSLKEKFKVDIYCWKNCFREQANLTLSAKAIRIFTELNIDLGVSLLCLPPESGAEAPLTDVGGWDTLNSPKRF
jgi:hypothetical protein